MSVFSRNRKISPSIELAPLIDVIFVLLIFFAVSSSFLSQNKGILLQLPFAKLSKQHPKSATIFIDRNQKIFLDNKLIEVGMIRAHFTKIISKNPNFQVILQADHLTPYKDVISVLDNIRLSGCYNIVLATTPPQ